MTRRRVAVTGLGVVSPIGTSVAAFRESLLAGHSGVSAITLFDPASLPTRIAAEVRLDGEVLRDRKITFALVAARQALADASRVGRPPGVGGLSLGLGLEVFSLDDLRRAKSVGFSLPESPRERLTFLQTPSDLCLHLISHELDLRAPPVAHVSACAAGTDAIGSAYRMVATGRRDFVLAGGTDSMINALGVAGFSSLGALSRRNDEPARASRPFERRRDGFVLGEGAGLLVLEPLDAARDRGATVYAEIAGHGNSFDAYGISEPHPEGLGALRAMRRALEDAGVSPDEVDAVSAHGTGTPKNDVVETRALKQLFGPRAPNVPISATKSMIGHLVSAAGAVETIAAILAMSDGVVHPTINLDEPDPACDLDYVAEGTRPHETRVVLKASFAFGGQNAALVLRRVS